MLENQISHSWIVLYAMEGTITIGTLKREFVDFEII